MFRRPFLNRLLVLTLAVASASPVVAGSSPEARRWLDKVVGIYESGPFTVDYTATIDLGQMGQAIRGEIDGEITYGDRSHRRLEMTMALAGLPGGGGDGEQTPMEMAMISVSDGSVVWTEIDMKALGSRQVMKIALEDVEKLASGQGLGGFAANPSSMDPVAQLEMLTENLDFEVSEVKNGRVTLTGKLVAEKQGSLGQLGALGVDSFVLILEEATGFPVEMSAGSLDGSSGPVAEPVVRMRFANLKQVEKTALPDGIFEYQPPDGIPVTDLATMLGAAN